MMARLRRILRGSMPRVALALIGAMLLALAPTIAGAMHEGVHPRCCATEEAPAVPAEPGQDHEHDNCPVCHAFTGLGGLALRLLDSGWAPATSVPRYASVSDEGPRLACAHDRAAPTRGPPCA